MYKQVIVICSLISPYICYTDLGQAYIYEKNNIKCPDNQIFYSGINKCGKIKAYDCNINPQCEPEDAGLLLPYPQDCSKYIYCGSNGEEMLSVCPPDLYYNPEIMGCVPRNETDCPCELTTTESSQVCEATPECSAENIGFNLPYPPDCRKYIYCSTTGTGDIRTCPPEPMEHFSPTQLICVDPALAGCEYCIAPSTQSTAEPLCPLPHQCTISDIGMVFPYSENCSLFIYCGEQGAEISVCPIGYEFSSNLICVPEAESDCVPCIDYTTTPLPTTTTTTSTPPPTTTTTTPASTTTTTTPASTTTTTTKPTVSTTTTQSPTTTTTIALCGEIPTCLAGEAGVTKPYPLNCSKYIYCTGEEGSGQMRTCPPDYIYSSTLGSCVPKENGTCRVCQAPTTLSLLLLPTCDLVKPCEIPKTNLALPSDCSKFIYCSEQLYPIITSCPSGKHFSPFSLSCISKEAAYCPKCIK